jgi:hypothetical protein
MSKLYELENASNSDEILADHLIDCTSTLREPQRGVKPTENEHRHCWNVKISVLGKQEH